MKAVIQHSYGSPDAVLGLQEIAIPMIKDDEVLVRVRAASVHPDVWHVLTGEPNILRIMGAGLRKPKNPVPGTDLAGHVESVGSNVGRFKPGDEVFGDSVGINKWRNGGAYAEYAAVRETQLELKPANLTFEQAAAVPTSGSIALRGLRDEGRIQPGQKVLINGAGGGVGSFAVQLAKANEAHVTAVDGTGKLDMLRSIGADHVIDYTQEDFTRSGERYDLILDIPGNHSWSALSRALTPNGTYVLIGHDQFGASRRRWIGGIGQFLGLLVRSPFVSQLHGFRGAKDPGDSLVVLKQLIDAGKITPAIDRTYPLSEVREAIRYLEEGSVLGKVVLTVSGPTSDHGADTEGI